MKYTTKWASSLIAIFAFSFLLYGCAPPEGKTSTGVHVEGDNNVVCIDQSEEDKAAGSRCGDEDNSDNSVPAPVE